MQASLAGGQLYARCANASNFNGNSNIQSVFISLPPIAPASFHSRDYKGQNSASEQTGAAEANSCRITRVISAKLQLRHSIIIQN